MKKILLLAMICTTPSLMFADIVTETIAKGVMETGTKAVTDAAVRDVVGTAGTAATNGLTVTSLGTIPQTLEATGVPQMGSPVGTTPLIISIPTLEKPMVGIAQQNLILQAQRGGTSSGLITGLKDTMSYITTLPQDAQVNFTGIKRNLQRYLSFHATANRMFQDVESQEELFLREVPWTYYLFRRFSLSKAQREKAKEFYYQKLSKEDIFENPESIKEALSSVLGLAYIGDETSGMKMVEFAKKAGHATDRGLDDEYKFIADFFVITALDKLGDTAAMEELIKFRAPQVRITGGFLTDMYVMLFMNHPTIGKIMDRYFDWNRRSIFCVTKDNTYIKLYRIPDEMNQMWPDFGPGYKLKQNIFDRDKGFLSYEREQYAPWAKDPKGCLRAAKERR